MQIIFVCSVPFYVQSIGVFNFSGGSLSKAGQLLKHRSTITSLEFSPDSKRLASGDSLKEVVIWDLESLQPLVTRMVYHTTKVTHLSKTDKIRLKFQFSCCSFEFPKLFFCSTGFALSSHRILVVYMRRHMHIRQLVFGKELYKRLRECWCSFLNNVCHNRAQYISTVDSQGKRQYGIGYFIII